MWTPPTNLPSEQHGTAQFPDSCEDNWYGGAQVGVLQVGMMQVGTMQMRTLHLRMIQVGLCMQYERTLQVGTLQVGTPLVGTLQVRTPQLRSLQVREDTTDGDKMKEHTAVGITHSTGRRPQAETHSGGSELLSASPCLTDCPTVCRKQGCIPDPKSSPLPGLTLNSELSQHGSSTCIPTGPTYDGEQGTIHSNMLPQPEGCVDLACWVGSSGQHPT